jgi:hypothetical protein
MFVCAICRRETERDDVYADLRMGRNVQWCNCLTCHDRDQGIDRAVSVRLKDEVADIVRSRRCRECTNG